MFGRIGRPSLSSAPSMVVCRNDRQEGGDDRGFCWTIAREQRDPSRFATLSTAPADGFTADYDCRRRAADRVNGVAVGAQQSRQTAVGRSTIVVSRATRSSTSAPPGRRFQPRIAPVARQQAAPPKISLDADVRCQRSALQERCRGLLTVGAG